MRKNKLFMICMMAGLLFTACEKEELNTSGSDALTKTFSAMTVGNKLDNAYSVENMKRAYNQLKATGAITENFDIKTTHLYVEITNVDSAQLDVLLADTTIVLFNYPLDYEIEGEGTFTPANGNSTLYTVVPANYNFGNITHTVLENCCIPDDKASDAMLLVEERALRMTGNWSEESGSKTKRKPEGTIKVYNTVTGSLEGAKKVKVVTQKLVNIKSTYTDENGYYKIDRNYLCDPNYSIIFDNKTGFKVWSNLAFLAPAYLFLGSHSNRGYTKNMYQSSEGWLWATINNGAYVYREQMCQYLGVDKPISNLRIWSLKMNGDYSGSTPMLHNITVSPANIVSLITLFNINAGAGVVASTISTLIHIVGPDVFLLRDFSSTEAAYQTIFHELSHASHYTQVGSVYWSNYVTQIIINMGYGNSANILNGIIGVGEMWGSYSERLCMHYYCNQSLIPNVSYWFCPKILYDIDATIPGMTPEKIFNCMTTSATNHQNLKANIKSNYGTYNGVNYNAQINAIFANYGF